MRKEKKHPIKNEAISKSIEEFLRNREENQMIDDHGPVVIGRRDRKPVLPKNEED